MQATVEPCGQVCRLPEHGGSSEAVARSLWWKWQDEIGHLEEGMSGASSGQSGHWQGHTGIGIWVQKHFVSSEGALYLKMPWPRL